MTPNSVVGMGMGMGSGDGEGGGGVVGEGGLKKGPWTASEDAILMDYVGKNGEGNWNAVQRNSGLNRCGKSCRLRWANHLRPNLKKGAFSPQEERLILQLHAKYGNKWARMAAQLPGRTDNEIKNYWNTRVKRRKRQGLPLYPHDIKPMAAQSQPTTPTSPLPATTPTTPTSTPTTPMAASSFFQFYNHSPTPSPTTMHSPLSSPHTFTPFPLIAPNSFTFHRPPPILAAPIRFKHFRPNNNSIAAAPGFSHHPTLVVHSPPPQPHFSRVESFQFPMTLATDSSSPPHIVHTHSGMVMGNECLGSLKQELPPTQFHQFNDEKMGSGMSFGMGLLEDMLEEAQVLACNYVNNNSSSSSSCLVSPEEQRLFDGFHNLAQHSSNPDDCMFLTKEEDGGGDQAHGSSATEDWSNLLNMQLPQCYTHDKQDHNQLSYGQTTIDQYQYQHQHQHQHHHVNVGGLDVQHIAALFPVSAQSDKPTTTNNSSCPWDNLPGIC